LNQGSSRVDMANEHIHTSQRKVQE
jgi:hypothetical protein